MPNAGKSTLVASCSNARPKVADYPFTTLNPQLGVVRTGPAKSFVIADIPGLIEGAAEGAGLGHQFLRHIQRTRLLLHLLDFAPMDGDSDETTIVSKLVRDVRTISEELVRFDPELLKKPRWLILNKVDLLPDSQWTTRWKAVNKSLRWKGEVRPISGLTQQGLSELMHDIQTWLDAQQEGQIEDAQPDVRFAHHADQSP